MLEHFRGEISSERAREIEGHLEVCDKCTHEVESMEAVGDWLAKWEDRPASEKELDGVRGMLGVLRTTGIEQHTTVNGQSTGRFKPWIRRAAMVAAVMLVTLLFQTFVWNPIKSSVNLNAVFNFSTEAYAMPAGEAVPDTVLVITAHPDETFSVPVLEGRYELDELVERLSEIIPKGRYKEILLTGTDPDNPVTVDLGDLELLQKALGIDDIHVGSAVIGRAALQFNRWLLPLGAQKWIIPGKEGEWLFKDTGEGRWALGLDNPMWSVLYWQKLKTDTLQSRSFENLSNIALLQSGLWFNRDRMLMEALTESDDVTATVNEEGDVVLSRAVVPLGEVEEALVKLKERYPDLSVTILIEEGTDPNETEKRLERIARRLGITIKFKKIDPDQ